MKVFKFKRVTKEQINSIGLAIFLCANPLSWIFPFSNVIVSLSFLSLLILLFNNKIILLINNKMFVVIFVLLLFIFSNIFARFDSDKFFLYLNSFLVFGITGILYSNCKIDYECFYKVVGFVALISIPGIYGIDQIEFESQMEASGFYMGVSYGVLRLILALLIVYTLLKQKFYKWISFVLIIFYLFFYFQHGTRGAFLAFSIFGILIFLENRNKLKIINLFLLLAVSYVASFYFLEIVQLLNYFLSVFNINIKALDKILLFYESNQDISNGRANLINTALIDIRENLFFGNGISVFDYKYRNYPHNFLVQIVYEGGVIYLIPVLLVFIKFIRLLISTSISLAEKKFLIYVFSAGIVELVFSNVYWRSVFFWFFIGLVLTTTTTTTTTNKKNSYA